MYKEQGIKKASSPLKDEAVSPCYHLNSQTAHTIRLTKYLTILLQYNGCSRRSLLIIKTFLLFHDSKYLQKSIFCPVLITFNAQLVNVFSISFPCASHHPATLCMFRSYLLVSVIAVFICNCFLHAHYYKSCIWKCQCKVCASCIIYLFQTNERPQGCNSGGIFRI